MLRRLFSRLFNRYTISILLIGLGLYMVFLFGTRALRSYQQVRYVHAQGLDQGTASVEAIQPWMTIRYVAVAYAVPEEYIFSKLAIPFDQRNSNDPLGRLNRKYDFGPPAGDEQPAIIKQVADAILEYRAKPVATGLDDIRPWMSIRYIANSTGVPEAYLLEQLGITSGENHAVMPLDMLADKLQLGEGPHAIEDALRSALVTYKEAQ